MRNNRWFRVLIGDSAHFESPLRAVGDAPFVEPRASFAAGLLPGVTLGISTLTSLVWWSPDHRGHLLYRSKQATENLSIKHVLNRFEHLVSHGGCV